ncbi:hypothetical protein SIN8267_02193 [Sinobacterium norvegicum]|uniref:VOC domain-containing protein n=1 Tax=Sinobacterium norvegicum TaxID=1641715 RepID=A0ABM9AFV1_9GAMM|nr:VOC family protein [Sinobacterium norvegicum]CAH0992078.1 hypothetical protein SIN8267_02193 [Sinobacterium norvegicum]
MNQHGQFGKVKQWGFLVKDLDKAMAFWTETLGVGPWWGYRNVSLESTFKGETNTVKMHVGLAFQNGVQIELIQQTNDVRSPYSEFKQTDKEQVMHQIAYFAPDIDDAVARAKATGMSELGVCTNMLGQRYYYMSNDDLGDLVVELMEVDDGFVADYERCAKEAEQWDGSEPYRLISL